MFTQKAWWKPSTLALCNNPELIIPQSFKHTFNYISHGINYPLHLQQMPIWLSFLLLTNGICLAFLGSFLLMLMEKSFVLYYKLYLPLLERRTPIIWMFIRLSPHPYGKGWLEGLSRCTRSLENQQDGQQEVKIFCWLHFHAGIIRGGKAVKCWFSFPLIVSFPLNEQ